MLEYHLMNEKEKEIICGWKYEKEYAIYNLPSFKELKDKQIGFCHLNRQKNFYTYYDGERLVGFTNILEEKEAVFIGIGVHLDDCDKGYGKAILEIVDNISNVLYPGKSQYLEVRSWNKRAIRCYEKAGFKIVDDVFEQETLSGIGKFYKMVKK